MNRLCSRLGGAGVGLLIFVLAACGQAEKPSNEQPTTPAATPSPTAAPAPKVSATPASPTDPSPTPTLDPKFNTCAEAIKAGYGNYRKGVDPEYDWYNDTDNDGTVCEKN